LGDSEVEDRIVDDDDEDLDDDDDFSRERKNSAREVPKKQDAEVRLGMEDKQLIAERAQADGNGHLLYCFSWCLYAASVFIFPGL
jgi:hypothetical protein